MGRQLPIDNVVNVTTLSQREEDTPEALLARPRWTRVRKVALIRRQVREYLPVTTVEVLLSEGETVFESGAEVGVKAERAREFGSMMVTVDLVALADRFRDRPDAATAARVAELLVDHPDLAPRLIARVRERLAGRRGDVSHWDVEVDPCVRSEGARVFIDADIVAAPAGIEVG